MPKSFQRRYPIGAECRDDQVSMRVWSPVSKKITVVFDDGALHDVVALDSEGNGYFSTVISKISKDARYGFRLNEDGKSYPDPASRFQPDGPHGLSQIISPDSFVWTDVKWEGLGHSGQVIYEMHIGTFSSAGTWRGAEERLEHLADLGVTIIEVMPVAEFTGNHGWGYDGVNFFAPSHLYGTPDDFRSFVNRAHALGVGVILDVVYNHFGPNGNYVSNFSPEYFTDRYKTDWGEAINYDGPHSHGVREFMISNVSYWISEFHLDGLRFDATQNIYDSSSTHILTAMTQAARKAAGKRGIFLVAENEEQNIRIVEEQARGGHGMDALWNDDLHHTALVALTGHREAYYTDYQGTPQEFVSAAKYGYLYQGQYYEWQKKNRGTSSLKIDPACFVTFLENHDQIANSGRGLRCHQLSNPSSYRALTAYLLLGPGTPMLFQGQEFGSTAPFFYFADHPPDLAKLVCEGRKKFLSQFPSLTSDEMQQQLANPERLETFMRSKLKWSECDTNSATLNLHRDLLRLRREDPVIAKPQRPLDGAVLSNEAFLIRFFADDGDDRLLVINLGRDLELITLPEPLTAAPRGRTWSIRWSSEDPKYGGEGVAPLWKNGHLFLPASTALLLVPATIDENAKGQVHD